MKIETPRLLLVPPKIEDANLLLEMVRASLKEISPWLNWAKSELTENDIKGFLEYAIKCHANKKPNNLFFSIWDKKRDKFIGDVYYGTIDWNIPYFAIGYWIDSRESGHGFITEAVNALTRVSFEYYAAKRVEVNTSVDNLPSKKIPERLGFILEATLKNHHINFLTKQISDTLIYAQYNLEKLPSLDVKWTNSV